MEQRRGWGRVMLGGKKHADFKEVAPEKLFSGLQLIAKRFPFQYSALFGLIDCRDAEDQPIILPIGIVQKPNSPLYYRFAISCTCARVLDHIC